MMGCFGTIALVVIIIVAISAGLSKATQPTAGNTNCSPAPCGNDSGFSVTVSNIQRSLPAGQFLQPEAGNHYVKVDVTFRNTDSSEHNANPLNFVLKDATGVKHTVTISDAAGCSVWEAVNLTQGATLGPKSLCFEAAGDPTGKLTLVWTPALSDVNIGL
jgi:hypothetical protein